MLNEDGEYIGFDIVIGNPPYGITILSNIYKNYFRQKFAELQFKIDTYSIFLLLSSNIIRKKGYCYFIIPSTFIDNFFV